MNSIFCLHTKLHWSQSEEPVLSIMEAPSRSEVSVRVLLFAGARELAGRAEGVLTGVPTPTDQEHLLDRVTEHFSLRPMAGSFILALNQDYVMPGDRVHIRDGDELAVIPPLSGG